MKTELITNVSHDLKTPLTSIISYTELLANVEGLPEEAKDYAQIIANKSDRLKTLTQDLFDISKAQSGNESVVLEKLDVSLLINQSLGEHDNEIKKSELPFCVNAPKELYISADGRKMSRVISNLISKEAIYDACSAESVRPLTDCVKVEDPEKIDYNIDFTYYISEDTQLTLTDIETAVTSAVNEYIAWQCAKLGRDINPDRLRYYLMQAGIKRMQIREPVFVSLRSGVNNDVPQIATLGTISVTNGGYEDE